MERRQRDRDDRQEDDMVKLKDLLKVHRDAEARLVARRMAHRQTYALAEAAIMNKLEHMGEQLETCKTIMDMRTIFLDATRTVLRFNSRVPGPADGHPPHCSSIS